ncbi:MAG: DNA-binding protein [Bacteroidaceae bacterium]|nr:DNA-binding protein [Bacteroidaceae bacterium]
MALKVKAVEKLIKFDKESAGTYRYVMSPELYIPLTQAKVIKEAALRSGVSRGVMQACWDAAGEVIKAWATEGHSVALPGLGTMRFGLRSKSVENVNDVKTGLITPRRIIFTPSTELKEELAATSVQITCYDRNGNEVKRVTSADDGEIEDNEGLTPDPSHVGEGSQNGGSNSGTENGGSQNGGTNTGNQGGGTGTIDTGGGNTGGNGGSTDPDDGDEG